MASTVKAGLTTNSLLKSIKRRAMVPDNQNTFTDQDFIDLMNEEMMIGIVPSILQMKEEYFIYKQVVPLVNDKSKYSVPERALANKLREVCYQDSVTSIYNEYEMTQIAIDDRYSGLYSGTGSNDFTGFRQFYMMGSDLVIHPSVGPNPTGALAFYYYLRPNTIVKESSVTTIIGIDRNASTIRMSTLPSGYSQDSVYDFVKAKSPHNIISIDNPVLEVNVSTRVVTFPPNTIPDDLEIGDLFCLAGQTAVPNIPTELHMVLAQRVAQRVLEALGDTEGLNNATAKVAEMEAKLSTMLTNRVEGAPRKVVNKGTMLGTGRNKRR